MKEEIQTTVAQIRSLLFHLEQMIAIYENETRWSRKDEEAIECTSDFPFGPGRSMRTYWVEVAGTSNARDYCANLKGVEACQEKINDLEITMLFFHLQGWIGQMSDRFRRKLDTTTEKLEAYRKTLFVLCHLEKIKKSLEAHIAELGG
ncbi:hypothetical protein J1N09_06815 [Aureitalea sp. L0-47]|uniref:hypothetical protein n=1 Tax=Aureitalea sp. L0-47 TaxID=2816962 RepID=UPI002238E81B|nr:hypothetical protein [Aureitalea sp. L0-47]MCW5519543.1 hypothetical protein [Aureitalea sp. L0-47]